MRGDVFLVEDDLDVLEYYRFFLLVEGFSVWAEDTNGLRAIERYRAATRWPDTIILDHRLPGCNGLTVAREVLRLDPDVPIIFLTADSEALESGRTMGLRRLKPKPCDNQRLLRNLLDAVAERRARRAATPFNAVAAATPP
jgi:CheY-like chemotaxis protein